MKVLIVGGGGREHALAWKLTRDDPALELLAAPGNPAIADLARCVGVAATDVRGLLALAREERVDFTVVGPEAPLEAGLVDEFRDARLAVFGPTRAAARIETSKRFAKELMLGAGVPTARATAHTDAASARRAARALGAPVVVKATGLAAGKGVVVCASLDEADEAIDAMLGRHSLGTAGDEVLVEEFMAGEELSLFAITDGDRALPMLGVQDHKRLLDGDRGPNTGGMGAYAPVGIATPELIDGVMRDIVAPTLAAMREAGCPFTGLLYAGLMLTADGPKVVEFNCRFGDPETQALLPLLDGSLLEPIRRVAAGETLAGAAPLRWRDAFAVTTVVASEGYPTASAPARPIEVPEDTDEVVVFHAGTSRAADGTLLATGGRVVAITGIAATLGQARARSLHHAERVQLQGRQLRRDIGLRELARSSPADRA